VGNLSLAEVKTRAIGLTKIKDKTTLKY